MPGSQMVYFRAFGAYGLCYRVPSVLSSFCVYLFWFGDDPGMWWESAGWERLLRLCVVSLVGARGRGQRGGENTESFCLCGFF